LAAKAPAPPFATPPTPHPQRRKIKQIAVAQKFAWWAAMCHAGLVSKVTFASKFGEKERQIGL